jgi:hypothetical protein
MKWIALIVVVVVGVTGVWRAAVIQGQTRQRLVATDALTMRDSDDRGRCFAHDGDGVFRFVTVTGRLGAPPVATCQIRSANTLSTRGISSPSALAVSRLMTNSNLVDCCTGRSAGLAPLRMLPA